MSFGRLDLYRSPEQLSRMSERDWEELLAELLPLRNAEAFAAICDLFSFWHARDERSRQLTRAVQSMAGWDDEIRAASSSYAGLYEGDRLSDVARLARSIAIHRRESRGSSELYAIATSEYVSELAGLSIVASEVSGPAWEALARSRTLQSLRRLAVRSSTMGAADTHALLQSTGLPALRSLELVRVGLRPHKVPRTWSQPSFPDLEAVDFSHNALGTEGVQWLADAPWFTHLRSVAVRHNFVSRAGVEALIHSPGAGELTTLDVRDNDVTAEDKGVLRALAARRGIELLI